MMFNCKQTDEEAKGMAMSTGVAHDLALRCFEYRSEIKRLRKLFQVSERGSRVDNPISEHINTAELRILLADWNAAVEANDGGGREERRLLAGRLVQQLPAILDQLESS